MTSCTTQATQHLHLAGNYEANHAVMPRLARIETPQQHQKRQAQEQTLATQQMYLQNLLRQRLLKAEQRGDQALLRQLRREWDEMFPNEPST